MTIDLTAPVPCVLEICDGCQRPGRLYLLIRTTRALCVGCFAREHG